MSLQGDVRRGGGVLGDRGRGGKKEKKEKFIEKGKYPSEFNWGT